MPTNLTRNPHRRRKKKNETEKPKLDYTVHPAKRDKPGEFTYLWQHKPGQYKGTEKNSTAFRTLEQALAAMYWAEKTQHVAKTKEEKNAARQLEPDFASCLWEEFSQNEKYEAHIMNESTKADMLVRERVPDGKTDDNSNWWQVQLKVSERGRDGQRWSFAWEDGNYDGMIMLCHTPDGPEKRPHSWFYDGYLFGKGKYLESSLTICTTKDGTKWDTLGWKPKETSVDEVKRFKDLAPRGRLLLDMCDEEEGDRCKAAAKMLVALFEKHKEDDWFPYTSKDKAARHFASKSHLLEWSGICFLKGKYKYKDPPMPQMPYDLVEKRDDGTEVRIQVKQRGSKAIRKAWGMPKAGSGIAFTPTKSGSNSK